MKATGVVRRIDDLGRIVIPKELRRTLKIREGDQLEISVDQGGYISLKKFSPLGDISNIGNAYIDALRKYIDHKIIITDMESIVSMSKDLSKKIDDKKLTKEIEDIIISKKETKLNSIQLTNSFSCDSFCYIKPLIAYGDCLGSVIILSKEELTDIDLSYIDILSSFFENYLLDE